MPVCIFSLFSISLSWGGGVAQINTSVGTLSVKYTKWLTEMKLHLP